MCDFLASVLPHCLVRSCVLDLLVYFRFIKYVSWYTQLCRDISYYLVESEIPRSSGTNLLLLFFIGTGEDDLLTKV